MLTVTTSACTPVACMISKKRKPRSGCPARMHAAITAEGGARARARRGRRGMGAHAAAQRCACVVAGIWLATSPPPLGRQL